MKPQYRLFSRGWWEVHQFEVMVAALVLLLVIPFLLYLALQNGNVFWMRVNLGLMGLGMLLIIWAA